MNTECNIRKAGMWFLGCGLALSAVLAPLTFGSSTSTPAVQGTQGTSTPVIREPRSAPRLQTLLFPTAFGDEKLIGDVQIVTAEKKLTIKWSYEDPTGERKFHWEDYDLAYWPTAAARAGDAAIVVTGKRPSNGKIVFEKWAIGLSALPDEAHPSVLAKTVLRDSLEPTNGAVRVMDPLAGFENYMLLVWQKSGDVYRLDTITGQMDLALSALDLPQLTTKSLEHLWVAEHPTLGFTYCLQCDYSVYDDGAVLLYDTDKDGAIDSWDTVAPGEWDSKVRAVDWVRRFNR